MAPLHATLVSTVKALLQNKDQDETAEQVIIQYLENQEEKIDKEEESDPNALSHFLAQVPLKILQQQQTTTSPSLLLQCLASTAILRSIQPIAGSSVPPQTTKALWQALKMSLIALQKEQNDEAFYHHTLFLSLQAARCLWQNSTGLLVRNKSVTQEWIDGCWTILLREKEEFLQETVARLLVALLQQQQQQQLQEKGRGRGGNNNTNNSHNRLIATSLEALAHVVQQLVPTQQRSSSKSSDTSTIPPPILRALEQIHWVHTSVDTKNDSIPPRVQTVLRAVTCFAQAAVLSSTPAGAVDAERLLSILRNLLLSNAPEPTNKRLRHEVITGSVVSYVTWSTCRSDMIQAGLDLLDAILSFVTVSQARTIWACLYDVLFRECSGVVQQSVGTSGKSTATGNNNDSKRRRQLQIRILQTIQHAWCVVPVVGLLSKGSGGGATCRALGRLIQLLIGTLWEEVQQPISSAILLGAVCSCLATGLEQHGEWWTMELRIALERVVQMGLLEVSSGSTVRRCVLPLAAVSLQVPWPNGSGNRKELVSQVQALATQFPELSHVRRLCESLQWTRVPALTGPVVVMRTTRSTKKDLLVELEREREIQQEAEQQAAEEGAKEAVAKETTKFSSSSPSKRTVFEGEMPVSSITNKRQRNGDTTTTTPTTFTYSTVPPEQLPTEAKPSLAELQVIGASKAESITDHENDKQPVLSKKQNCHSPEEEDVSPPIVMDAGPDPEDDDGPPPIDMDAGPDPEDDEGPPPIFTDAGPDPEDL